MLFRLLLALLFALSPVHADEGMWPVQSPPVEEVRNRHDIPLDQAWLDKVRRATVRVNEEGSGSFVSPDGLVATNHHVIMDRIAAMSDGKKDYYAEGFFAPNRSGEIKIPVLILGLESWEDVTGRIENAAPAEREAAIEAVIAECGEGLQCEVARQKTRYLLYRYKKYNDVRLVMVPEAGAAYYGMEGDDRDKPFHRLDFAFLRVYGDDAKPIRSPDYFPWNLDQARQGKVVFTSGFPYKTDRVRSLNQFLFERDFVLPIDSAKGRAGREAVVAARGTATPEQLRAMRLQDMESIWALQLNEDLVGALPKLEPERRRQDQALRAAIDQLPAEQKAPFAGLWDADRELFAKKAQRQSQRSLSELSPGGSSRLEKMARDFLEYVRRPTAEAKINLLKGQGVNLDLERRLVEASLSLAIKTLGEDDPFVSEALHGCSAHDTACRVTQGTRLNDPEFRRELLEGGAQAIENSSDPFLSLARRVEPRREELKRWEEELAEKEAAHALLFAQARAAAGLEPLYPDADWTMRLSVGKISGYDLRGGRVPHQSTFHGLFDKQAAFENQEIFRLPARLQAAKGSLRLDTPVNFYSSNDIAGGNSGSAVFDTKRRFLGLVYDANRGAVADVYCYNNDAEGRTVNVDAAAILESLRGAYPMRWLAEELTEAAVPPPQPAAQKPSCRRRLRLRSNS